jgi:hypothetical protein
MALDVLGAAFDGVPVTTDGRWAAGMALRYGSVLLEYGELESRVSDLELRFKNEAKG